ncbi:hypothetical protein ACFY8W_35070 [Streptomyces sp. NPDC012637]|uniref:hypothetical protein n=1 Tax=Streptomyces sp. NPDC012637 TaxID=3364842 RepID=UPI0036F01C05
MTLARRAVEVVAPEELPLLEATVAARPRRAGGRSEEELLGFGFDGTVAVASVAAVGAAQAVVALLGSAAADVAREETSNAMRTWLDRLLRRRGARSGGAAGESEGEGESAGEGEGADDGGETVSAARGEAARRPDGAAGEASGEASGRAAGESPGRGAGEAAGDGPATALALSPEQLTRLRRVAREKARAAGVDGDTADLIADAIVGGLVL